MTAPLSDEMLVRWRRLAQVDISAMQADTAIVELSRAVLLLLDGYSEQGDRTAKWAGLLKQSYRQHDWVDEDCWYSCPKADDYCGDKPRDKCLCGADEWNAKVDAALAVPA